MKLPTPPLFSLSALLVASTLALVACASAPASALFNPVQLDALLPTDVLLLGEQHDAPEHQQIHREAIALLASRQQLAAVVIEMANQPTSTTGLPADASETSVQNALQWQTSGWPWPAYGPAVMAAVRAGVPVLGGNLARPAMRDAMKTEALDQRLPTDAWQQQQRIIRDGHCGLLPESQLPSMARIQVARDVAMADVAASARQPGKAVLVLAGSAHVNQRLGIPAHFAPDITSKSVLILSGKEKSAIEKEATAAFNAVWPTPPVPPKDYCAELRQSMQAPASKP